MIALTRDEQLFRKFYEDEQTYPTHWKDGNNVWTTDWDSFKAFCDKCERIYNLNDNCLVYVERIGRNANIHFSLLRGSSVDVSGLVAVRDELLADYDTLLAYVGSHNRGLRRIVEQCGMRYTGVDMRKGSTRGKALKWQLFSVSKKSLDLMVKDS